MKRFISWIAVVLLAIGILVWVIQPQAVPSQTRILQNGHILRVELLTAGTNHTFSPRAHWKEWLASHLPASMDHWFGTPNLDGFMTTSSDMLCVWMSLFDPTRKAYESFGACTFELEDEHGCILPGYNTGGSGGPSIQVSDVLFGNFPRRSNKFRMHWRDTAQHLEAEFELLNPVAGPFPVWRPETLPAVRTNGDLAFTLQRIKVTGSARPGHGRELNYSPEITISRQGKPEAEWQLEDYTYQDATGNRARTLCRFEPAWKLEATYYQSAEARFEPESIAKIDSVKIPAAGQITPINQTIQRENGRIEAIALCGPGMFEWSNNVCISAKALEKPYNSTRTQVGAAYEKTEVVRPKPFLWLRFRGDNPSQKLRMRGYGENGESLEVGAPYTQSWEAVTVNAPPGAEVHFELIPVNPVKVEFLVKPPNQDKAQ